MPSCREKLLYVKVQSPSNQLHKFRHTIFGNTKIIMQLIACSLEYLIHKHGGIGVREEMKKNGRMIC